MKFRIVRTVLLVICCFFPVSSYAEPVYAQVHFELIAFTDLVSGMEIFK